MVLKCRFEYLLLQYANIKFLESSNGDASIKEPGDDSPLGKGKGNMSSSIYIQDQVRG